MASTREMGAMSDAASEHMRRHHNEYTLRLPTPPRISVPPPTSEKPPPSLVIRHDATELSFLRDINLNGIPHKDVLVDWAYERRRQAQMILPWLYLGPMVAVKDQEFLKREGISMVLAVRAQPKSLMGAMKAAQEVCEEVLAVEAPTFHGIVGCLRDTTRMINGHIIRKWQHSLQNTGEPALGKVLVFCESGNEKAAAVVGAYLMETLEDLDYVKAMQICQARRFCVNFDDTIKNVLRNYWDIIQARRSVESSSINSNGASIQPQPQPQQQKRSIEHTMEDDDMDMDGHLDPSDALRFANRDVTPFQSREF